MTDNNNRYFTLLTDKGKFKIAKAAADKGEVKFSHFAIGDGGGQEVNPTPNQTALVHEVWRAQLDSVEIDPKNPAAIIINAIIPHNVGGFWMREFGLFDVDGDMLAVVKPAPNYKATSAEGQLEDVYYEFQLVIGEQAQVVVLVDPSILWATREYVETRRISAGQMMNTPWLPVKALNVATPPSSNNQGDTYVIPTGAKGDWKDKSGQLAEWNGQNWNFYEAPDGHGVGLPDGRLFIRVNNQYIEAKATTERAGFVELATIEEAAAKKDDQRAVTPLGLATVISKIGYTTLVFKDVGTTTWTVPSGVNIVDVRVWGAGGGGGGSYRAGASGGGGGGFIDCKGIQVTPGQQILVTVGTGGNGGYAVPTDGKAGGASSFGIYATAYGGGGGYAANGTVALKRAVGGNAVGSGLVVAGQSGQTSIGIGDNYFMGGQGGGTYGTTNSIVSTSVRGPNGAYPGGGGCGDPNGFGGGDGANGLVVVSFIKEQSA